MHTLDARYDGALPGSEITGSEAAILASKSCAACRGVGVTISLRYARVKVCDCVYRRMFRICFERYLEASTGSGRVSDVVLERCSKKGATWGFKRREYCADVALIARRTLDSLHYAVFRLFFLAGQDFRFCCRRLRIDRGRFFHAVYRVEKILGQAFCAVRPYPLFPPRAYFAGHVLAALPIFKLNPGHGYRFAISTPSIKLRLAIQKECNHAA